MLGLLLAFVPHLVGGACAVVSQFHGFSRPAWSFHAQNTLVRLLGVFRLWVLGFQATSRSRWMSIGGNTPPLRFARQKNPRSSHAIPCGDVSGIVHRNGRPTQEVSSQFDINGSPPVLTHNCCLTCVVCFSVRDLMILSLDLSCHILCF